MWWSNPYQTHAHPNCHHHQQQQHDNDDYDDTDMSSAFKDDHVSVRGAAFRTTQTVRLKRVPEIYWLDILKSIFSGSSRIFPASLAIATPIEGHR